MPRIIVDEFLSIFFILVSFIGVVFKDAVPYNLVTSAFVFALFMLNLFAGNRNAFSLCGLFVVVTYGGQELLATGRGDNVGHVNHLVGMVSGAVFGSVHSLFRARLSRFLGKK